jgi:hypothetical protein
MNEAAVVNVCNFVMSPVVLRVALVALGAIVAGLVGPATAYACGINGGGCGG